jgi:hypothetical protein
MTDCFIGDQLLIIAPAKSYILTDIKRIWSTKTDTKERMTESIPTKTATNK